MSDDQKPMTKGVTTMSDDQKPLTKLPRGILPDGINLPPGTDIMQFCRDLAESGADFAEQFDPNSATYHGLKNSPLQGLTTAVPTGGARMPDSMGGNSGYVDWQSLPDAPLAIEEDFGADFHAAVASRERLNECKKAISVLNKPVEMAMRLRLQYKEAVEKRIEGVEGDNNEVEDNTAWLSRLKGVENARDGALSAATEVILNMPDTDISQRTRDCVKAVVDEGKFQFEDKERFGEYMQTLQKANQSIFADQTKLLARIKDIKKAAKQTQLAPEGEKKDVIMADDTVPTSATVAAGA